MADFSKQEPASGGTGSSPQQATAPAPSMATTVAESGILKGAVNIFSGVASGIEKAAKAEKQSLADSIMSNYALTVTGLNESVAQGNKSFATAQREQRAAYNKIVASYPSMTEDLTKFNTQLLASEGLGDVLAKGTEVDQQIKADTKAATAAGFIQPNMSQSEQAVGLNAYREQQHQLNQMDFYSKQLNIQKEKMSIVAQQESIAASRVTRQNQMAQLQETKNKQRLQASVSDINANYYVKATGSVNEIEKKLQTGELTPEQALAGLDKLGNDYNALTIQARGVAGSDYIDSLAKPLNDMLKAKRDVFSGKISAEVGQNQVDLAVVKSQLPLMANPEVAKSVGISKIYNGILSPTIVAKVDEIMVGYLTNNSNKETPPSNNTSADKKEKQQTGVYFDGIKDVINNLDSKNPSLENPKDLFKETQTHVNQILKGVTSFAGAQENPSQLNAVTDFFASPEFLKYQRMGGQIDQAYLEGATNTVSINYGDKMTQAVRDEWERANTTVGYPQSVQQVGRVTIPVENTEPTSKAIQYSWTGNSIKFKPAPGLEQNKGAVAKARELQTKLAPLINKSVRMHAHLEGSDNYTKYFQEDESLYFGAKGTPSNAGE